MFAKKTLFQGSNIPDWVLESRYDCLFEAKETSKRVIIKQVIHASSKAHEKLELLLTELCDGTFYIPAIFQADMVREEIGRTDLTNMSGCKEFDSKVINITEYMIPACRLRDNICPYIIVLDFQIIENNNSRYSLQPPLGLTNVCNNEQVMTWLGKIKQSIQKRDQPLSTYFDLECLKDKYVNYQSMEQMLEFLLTNMYRDDIKISTSSQSTITNTNSTNNKQSNVDAITDKDEAITIEQKKTARPEIMQTGETMTTPSESSNSTETTRDNVIDLTESSDEEESDEVDVEEILDAHANEELYVDVQEELDAYSDACLNDELDVYPNNQLYYMNVQEESDAYSNNELFMDAQEKLDVRLNDELNVYLNEESDVHLNDDLDARLNDDLDAHLNDDLDVFLKDDLDVFLKGDLDVFLNDESNVYLNDGLDAYSKENLDYVQESLDAFFRDELGINPHEELNYYAQKSLDAFVNGELNTYSNDKKNLDVDDSWESFDYEPIESAQRDLELNDDNDSMKFLVSEIPPCTDFHGLPSLRNEEQQKQRKRKREQEPSSEDPSLVGATPNFGSSKRRVLQGLRALKYFEGFE